MIDTWNPAKLNEKISGRDSWNPAILNEAVTDRDSWNPAILNESAGETPVVFEATITASFPEGATCTATDGTTTLTADDNPMAFNIPNEGTWTVACVANGVTLSEDVVIATNGQTETVDLTPDGATVTPTDSVPMLIACAGIGDSEIATIAGALADVETLSAILESTNAIDYLVRSTTFASDVTADSVAMTGIGAINYDADTLLADSTWLTAICNSIYFESVLNEKVPVMTSATTPSGEVTGSNQYQSNYPYLAFDGNDNTIFMAAVSVLSDYSDFIGYEFTSLVAITKMLLKISSTFNVPTKKYKIQGYSGTDWIDLDNGTFSLDNTTINVSKIFSNQNKYYKYRVLLDSMYVAGSYNYGIKELQFYGRQDVE